MRKNKEKTENSMKVPQDKVIGYTQRKIDNDLQRKRNTYFVVQTKACRVSQSLVAINQRERNRERETC